jgi:hypothetical protein
MLTHFTIVRSAGVLFTLGLAACGGGGGGGSGSSGSSSGGTGPAPGPAPATPTHRVGGTVAGYAGRSLVLQNSGGDDLAPAANGTFFFATSIAEGAAYSVTIKTQPESPAQTCVVANGSGNMGMSDITAVSVTCTTAPLKSLLLSQDAGGTQRDLLLINEDGSGLLPLANSIDEEYFGGIAPDGRLVYRRESGGIFDAYSVRLDGSGLVALEQSTSRRIPVAVTSTNRVIIQGFKSVSISDEDLYVVNTDGTNELPLAISALDEEFKAVTASGRVIYSARTTVSGSQDLYAINTDGTGNIQLTTFSESDEFAAVTPGGRVLFHRNVGGLQNDLYSVKEDGTGLAALANDVNADNFVALLPNERVVFSREQTAGSSIYDLFAVNADGTGLATLANSADSEGYAGTTPDGRVLFHRIVGGTQSDVYSINPDGSALTALANSADSEGAEAISATNKVAIGRNDGTKTNLLAVNSDGTNVVRLTNTVGDDDGSHWFGDRLVFERETNGLKDLYSIRADGSGLTQLTNTPNDYEYVLAVTPLGRVIYKSEDASGGNDLYAVFLDGTGSIRLTNNQDNELVELLFEK